MSEFPRQAPVIGGSGARQETPILRLPSWVVSRIAVRDRQFTGQLVVNFFQGGVTNIEWREIQKQAK